MRFYLCRVNGVLGLLQVDGGPGQPPLPVIHPRNQNQALTTLIDQLRGNRYNAGTFPSMLDNCLVLGWWSYPDLARFSKWCSHDSPAESVARKLCRLLFRHGNEEDFVLPRLRDQRNQPKNPYFGVPMTADEVFLLWATHVVQHWGGRVEAAHDFPNVQAARQHFNNNP